MTELTREKLNKILEEHKHWINEDCENWKEMRAYLRGANLRYVSLRGADLHNADLSEANLRGADLRDANLRYVSLRGADLHNADLSEANLRGADLRDANLRYVSLRGADLHNVDLRGANLRGADLSDANLRYVSLRGADLHNADLTEANLRGADLSDAKNVPYIPMVCPEEGSFIGWKKAEGSKVIVKLRIPSDAKRSSATTRKCRCSKAEVIAIYNLDGTIAEEKFCHSDYDNSFIYEVGKTVEVTDFSEDRWRECTKGIHFFISRQEAINY